jgi:hypothetical protein
VSRFEWLTPLRVPGPGPVLRITASPLPARITRLTWGLTSGLGPTSLMGGGRGESLQFRGMGAEDEDSGPASKVGCDRGQRADHRRRDCARDGLGRRARVRQAPRLGLHARLQERLPEFRVARDARHPHGFFGRQLQRIRIDLWQHDHVCRQPAGCSRLLLLLGRQQYAHHQRSDGCHPLDAGSLGDHLDRRE